MSSSSFAERIEQAPELVVEAEDRLAQQDFAGAIALLEPAFQAGVDSPELVAALIKAYEGAGDSAKREMMMAVALEKSSESPLKLRIAYAEAAMTRKDWPAAIERWQSIIDRDEAFPPQIYLRQARALLAAEQFAEALRVVNLALEKQPGNTTLADLKNVIASHKAKKFQLAAHKLAAPIAIRWEVDEGQKQITNLESFRHYRIRGWVDARQDQWPELIASTHAGTDTLGLTAVEPSAPYQEAGWMFEHTFDLSRGLTLGVRLEGGKAYECLRFSLAPVMEVIEGREGWLFLANDTNASIDQFTGKRLLTDDETHQWHRFSAELAPLQQQRSLLFLIANSKEKVRPEYYPFEKADITTTEQVSAILQQAEVDYANPVAAMQAVSDSYYQTDTHWSGRGAYLAFVACMRYFGLDDDFDSLYDFEQRELVGDLGSKIDPPAKSLSTAAVFQEKSGVACRFSNHLPGTGNITIFENSRPRYTRTLLIFGGSSSNAGGFALLFAHIFQRVVVINLPGSYVQEIVDHEAADYVILQTNERYLATPGRILQTLDDANLDGALRGISASERIKLLERMNRYAPCEPYHSFMTALLAPSEAVST
ncbi:alginate O-acetyltransferase AlgX-related protein [Salinicola halophyticus]|uniref:alginate O-acetyltransferase AlgX-related protein n=1 Tax=Salinicola halophyticus TaxID=1808881 RepID=UPI003F486436